MELLKLTNETIDLLSDRIADTYTAAGCTKKEVLRARLLLEEALLKYQSRLGEDVELYYRAYRLLGQYRFSVRLRAPAFDPFTLEENPMAFMIRTIMADFENGMPTWKYKNLENELDFTVSRKSAMGSLTKLLLSVAAALLLGILARLCFPADGLAAFVTNYVDPLSDAYAGLFCIMAVLLTFFSITLSIVHIGDMASVGALGGRIMLRFFLICGAAAVVLALPILPFFDLSGAGMVSLAAKSIYDILIGFIPTNLVSPFLNFNSVHIMIIGVMFGFSLLAMGQKGSTLTAVFDECNLVAVYSNSFLNRFIFLYAALKLFSIVTTSRFARLDSAGIMVGVIVAAELLLLVFYTARVCVRLKMPLSEFLRIIMPPFMVCLTSANWSAAFSTAYDAIMAGNVDPDTANLSINLGSVFFQPACTVVFVISSLFMASAYGVEISAVWVIMSVLLSVILVSTMPNIPGASVSVITLLFAQLGIPAEALSIMIAVNALLQFLTVAVDAWCLVAETCCLNANLKKG